MKWLLGIAALAMCVVCTGQSLDSPEIAHAAVAKTHFVMIHGYAFMPQHLVIKAGDTVIWINRDSDIHTVTGDGNAAKALRSRSLGNTVRYRVTFSRPGTFRYHCEFHPFMRGIIVVRAAQR